MPEDAPAAAASTPKRVFAARLISTVLLLGMISIALAFRLDWPLVLVIAAFGILGTWEYIRFQGDDAGGRPYGIFLLTVASFYWLVVAWFGFRSRSAIPLPGQEAIPLWVDAATLLVIVHGSFALALRGPLEGERTLQWILGAFGGALFTILPGAFFLRLLFFGENDTGAHLLFLMILVVKFGDMGAYLIGSLIGRHKMIPHISPKKTWEGFGGAILGSCFAFAGIMLFDGANLVPLHWATGLGFAVLLSLAGVHGDLAESVLKRCHGVKDSGQTLPGIGGILDLTDSMLFAAPVAYFYLRAIA